jgi:CBS domain-containing protein
MKCVADFITDVPVLRIDDQVTKARAVLRDDIYREIFVQDGKKALVGYVDITDVLKVTATKSNVTIEGYIKEITPVHPEDTVECAAKVIGKNKTDSAPVVDGQNRILGGVLLSDLFPVIITRNELRGTVRDHMTTRVITCAPEDSVQKVNTLILETGHTAFPVVSKGVLKGIISRRDLLVDGRLRNALEGNAQVQVDAVMIRELTTITPGESVAAAAEKMAKYDISRIPVMNGDRMVGILDRHDILKGLA